jgi:hypothetical protein
MESVVSELPDFVERARGLRFREPVKVRVVSEPSFAEALKNAGPESGDLASLDTVLTILGLLPPEADLPALVAAAEPSRVAFYDPAGRELVVGEEPTPAVRIALVHELAHTLDDQHFGIDREVPKGEAAVAFQALVEGSAARVERLYVSSLPEDEQRQIEAKGERIRAASQVPPAAGQLVDFPRLSGPAFVEALSKEGPDRIDRAFSSPPTTSEQIFDPARYLSGEAPQQVGPPRTEGEVVDQGDIGPVLLRLLLESKLDPAVAGEAAAGWDGDRYSTWRSPDGRTCIRAQFAADTPGDARQLEAALAEWVRRVTDREVDSAGLLLKACGSAPGRP